MAKVSLNQVIDETIWKEKIAGERRAKEYWETLYCRSSDKGFTDSRGNPRGVGLSPISYFNTKIKLTTSKQIGAMQQKGIMLRLQSSQGNRLKKSDLLCTD